MGNNTTPHGSQNGSMNSGAPSRAPSSPGGRTALRKRRPWNLSEVSALVDGTMEPRQVEQALQMVDPRGLDPFEFATLKAAAQTDALTALLGEETPTESSQLKEVVELLQTMAAVLARIEERQLEHARQIAELRGALPATSPRRA